MATYVNNLRLKEIVTGEETGTWGTSTNTNLELIGEALGYGTEALTTNADTQTITMADGASDGVRALYLKITGALDSTCAITLAPNTVKKVWIIENATTDSGSSGPYSITVQQGSGGTVTIANSKVLVVYTDGGGGGAVAVDALTDLVVTDSFQVAGPALTIGDAAAEDTKLLFDGNAKDFYVGLDDSADKLVIGEGSTVGTNSILTITDDTVVVGDGAAVDTSVVFDGNAKDFYIGLDDSADKLVIGEGSTVGTNNILTITDDTVIIGDAAATDTAIVFDGNAQDFYIGLDDSVDDLVIGLGSTVGTTPAVTIDENQAVVFPAAFVTVGDGTAEDTKLVYNGNAQDYYIGLDDSADDLVIGLGSTVGTTPAVTIDENQAVVFPAAAVTIGDGTAEDTKLVYNGNAQDYYIGLDDSADDLVIGLGSTVGTTPAISIDASQDVTLGSDVTLAATKKIYLDGGDDTYIAEYDPNKLEIVANGVRQINIMVDETIFTQGAVFGGPISTTGNVTLNATKKVYLDGGTHTYIVEYDDNKVEIVCNGVRQIDVMVDETIFTQAATFEGSVSKASGSFKIDHPLPNKKDTHHLVHSFHEGPRADLWYRGRIALVNGSATVDLDEAAGMTQGTWELLCRDPQCWVQNDSGWLVVRGSVEGSTLTIECNDVTSDDTVSWMVVAERCDQHIMETGWTDDDGRVIVEPLKPSEPPPVTPSPVTPSPVTPSEA